MLNLGSSYEKEVLNTVQAKYQGRDDISVETIPEKEKRLLVNTFMPLNYSALFITEDFLITNLLNCDID